MPHIKLAGKVAVDRVMAEMPAEVHRWGRAVLKIDACWRRADGRALLVEGVVVEHSRPLRPVIMVALQEDHIVVRLWPTVAVERTESVRRLLGLVAAQLQDFGGGPVIVTNIDESALQGLPLVFADSACDPSSAPES